LQSSLPHEFIQMLGGQLQTSRQVMMAWQSQQCLPRVDVWWQSVMAPSKLSLEQQAGSYKLTMLQGTGKQVNFVAPASHHVSHWIRAHTKVNSPGFSVLSP
jgi:hypothetical protein